jgi:seryl-tRNA synthetase
MFDTKLLEDIDFIKTAMERRGPAYVETLNKAQEFQIKWKSIKQKIDGLKHNQKSESKKMREVKGDDALALRSHLKSLSDEIKAMQVELNSLDEKRIEAILHLPNIPNSEIPTGGEENNIELERIGTPTKFDFTPKPHWEIGEELGILEFESATKMSGSRFSLLIGMGARLERGLIQFMLDKQGDAGYTEVSPPLIVKREAMVGTGQVPHLEEDTYKTDQEEPFYLIPTAEVVLVNMRREQIFDSADLPLCFVAMTPCFRSEAGSYGRDVRGLVRQHQFYKVELVKITKPEDSHKELDNLRNDAENILKLLKLPYRRLLLASKDMGFAANKTYDLDVWIPSEENYREISSCSNCTDFQARRAKIRFRRAKGEKPELCHTINGSGLAVGRTLLAILENYQNSDGSVTIPEVLIPYMGGITKISPKK